MRLKYLVLCAVVFLCQGCAGTFFNHRKLPRNAIFLIPDDKLDGIIEQAYGGDADAAFAVYQHFSFGHCNAVAGAIFYEWAYDLGCSDARVAPSVDEWQRRFKNERKLKHRE